MNITAIHNNISESKTTFTSNVRRITNEAGKIINGNSTMIFRDDLHWSFFVETINRKFSNVPKVNVICQACSDGSEPYSLAMLLMSKLGKERAQKFFPIIAKDKDPFFLKFAKRGMIFLTNDDQVKIYQLTGQDASTFFSITPKQTEFFWKKGQWALAKKELIDAVKFEQANILTDIEKIPTDDTILMCRNFWPYLGEANQAEILLEKIRSRLGENSMVVVGEFDNIAEKLALKGLYDMQCRYCFEVTKSESRIYPYPIGRAGIYRIPKTT